MDHSSATDITTNGDDFLVTCAFDAERADPISLPIASGGSASLGGTRQRKRAPVYPQLMSAHGEIGGAHSGTVPVHVSRILDENLGLTRLKIASVPSGEPKAVSGGQMYMPFIKQFMRKQDNSSVCQRMLESARQLETLLLMCQQPDKQTSIGEAAVIYNHIQEIVTEAGTAMKEFITGARYHDRGCVRVELFMQGPAFPDVAGRWPELNFGRAIRVAETAQIYRFAKACYSVYMEPLLHWFGNEVMPSELTELSTDETLGLVTCYEAISLFIENNPRNTDVHLAFLHQVPEGRMLQVPYHARVPKSLSRAGATVIKFGSTCRPVDHSGTRLAEKENK